MSHKVSIIIPARNEEAFIIKTLESIMAQDYPNHLLEVIIADGESNDRTCELIKGYIKNHSNVVLINNPERVVPYALNYAIEKSTGDVIVRLDAHSKYPVNYVSRLVEELIRLKADNVGGVWVTTPVNNGLIANAIALATSHPLGIGNASYRLENKKVKEVDTVPFGCFTREVFDRIGVFDTDLIRNQDDEFNGRIIKNGGKIYLIPDVEIEYYARGSIFKMTKMFYQYGLFKPLVNLKLGSPATARQFIPPLFVIFLLLGSILFVVPWYLNYVWFALLAVYLIVTILVSVSISLRKGRFGLVWILPFVFPLIHISYGIGYLEGLLLVNVLNKKPGGANFSTSR
ncbi:MAG: glycosyltransferase family 2 protein [Salibacteraceae bacterium]